MVRVFRQKGCLFWRTLSLAMSRVCMRPCDTILGSKSKSSISQRCRKSLKDICTPYTPCLSAQLQSGLFILPGLAQSCLLHHVCAARLIFRGGSIVSGLISVSIEAE